MSTSCTATEDEPTVLTNLKDLPDDIFLHVASHLGIRDILALRETCRTLRRATQLKHLWHQVVCAESGLSPQLASLPYSQPFTELSSSQLETLARHYDAVQSQILSGMKPAYSVNLDGARPVTWVHILRGQWMLVATSDSPVSELSLWSLPSVISSGKVHQTPLPAATTFLRGPVADGIVDFQDERVIIALEIRSPDSFTEILSISTKDDSPVFVRLANLPGVSRIRCLSGSFLGFALWNEISIPCTVDWRTKEVVQLRERPDVTGGCVAMACRGDLLALVTTECLDVYERERHVSPRHSYRLVSSTPLPGSVFDAALAFIDSAHRTTGNAGVRHRTLCALRLLRVDPNKGGLNVYDVEVTFQSDAVMHKVWSHPIDDDEDRLRPAFGKQISTLSWFAGQTSPPWEYIQFHTSAIPMTSQLPASTQVTSPVAVYKVSDPELPALHFMGVRDYDETVGILVVGNGCGELKVFDVAGNYSSALTGCLLQMPFPPATESRLMPTHPIPAVAAPPYPYSMFSASSDAIPSREVRDTWLARWKPKQPVDVPRGWTTEFYEPQHNSTPWWFWIPTVGENIAWELERSFHFLGTPTPLLYNHPFQTTIFTTGGLLFIFNEEQECMHVLRHGLSASDVARAFNENRIADHIAHTVFRNSTPMCTESGRYLWLWDWEKYMFSRNRWRELKDRGGEVDDGWLTDSSDTLPQPFLDPEGYIQEHPSK